MPTNSNRHRYEVDAAGSVLRSIVPDPDALRSIGSLVADVCQRASDAAPNCWEVTLQKDVLRVNVYMVRSTEADKIGYDLHCSRRGEVRHVEVKGRALDGNVVILTRGERERAQRDDRWFLAIVSRANSEMAVLLEWAAAEIPKRFRIDPIAFRVALRSDEDDAE